MLSEDYKTGLTTLKNNMLSGEVKAAEFVELAKVEVENLTAFMPDADAETKAGALLYLGQMLNDASFMHMLMPEAVDFDYLSKVSFAAAVHAYSPFTDEDTEKISGK